MLPVVDRQLLPARSQDHGDGRPAGRRSGPHGHGPRLLGARRARATAATAPARRGTPGTSRIYDDATVAALLAGAAPIADDEHRAAVKRFNATLVNHLFLLYFDTRAGYGDTGPYAVPGEPGRTFLVRDFYRLAHGDFPWSDVAKDVPYHHLTAALVLDDVQSTFTDFGTSNHTPGGLPRPARGLRPLHHRRPPAGRAAAGAGRRARRHRRRGAQGAGPALPQHRGDGPRREDPRRRLRVLQLPPALRRDRRRGRRAGLDGAPRPARAAVPALLGDPGRERQRPRGRAVLRPLPRGAPA